MSVCLRKTMRHGVGIASMNGLGHKEDHPSDRDAGRIARLGALDSRIRGSKEDSVTLGRTCYASYLLSACILGGIFLSCRWCGLCRILCGVPALSPGMYRHDLNTALA